MIHLAIKIFLILWFINRNDYTNKYKTKLVNKLYSLDYYITDKMAEILDCLICSSFWFISIITLNIWLGLAFSLLASIIVSIEEK